MKKSKCIRSSERPSINNMKLSVERMHASKVEREISDEEEELIQVSEQLEYQSNLINAASKRVEQYKKDGSFLFSATAVSDRSSIVSTCINETSIPESIDGGFAEVEELKLLNPSLVTCLKICRVLSRRVASTLLKLEAALKDNEAKQASLEAQEHAVASLSIEENSLNPGLRVMVRPALFSIPYFKDRSGTTAPMNPEAVEKVNNGYLDLYTTKARSWLTTEKNLLRVAVLDYFKTQMVNRWTKEKKIVERKMLLVENENTDEDVEDDLTDEFEECSKHLKFFNSVPIEKLEVPLDFEVDWSHIAAQLFNGNRTPQECHLQWKNNLHPRINIDGWGEKEDITITKLVSESNGKPKWDQIAAKLNSGRTPFQVMQRYVSFIKPALEPCRWNKEDSEKLINVINTLRVGDYIPWVQVSQHILGYTTTQIQTHWRSVNPSNKKGQFTCEEDYTLLKGLYRFGLNWNLIISFLPERRKIQAKNRFKLSILPGLTYKPWKAKEDKKILENCSSESKHWRVMSSMLRTRSSSEIRLRFYTLQFWKNISGRTIMPPPLFPISDTTRTAEINKMRKVLNSLNKRFTGVIDTSLIKGNYNKFRSIPEVENVESMSETEEPHSVAAYSTKTKKKHKKVMVSARVPIWPNRALVEFFLPSRLLDMKGAHDAMDHKAAEVTSFLSRMMQLKIKNWVTKQEEETLEELQWTNDEFCHINRMVEANNISNDACGELIGLIPPNTVTVGAFRSLLLHKQKLKEMSTNCFLFHRIPRSLFFKLGTKEKDLATVLANKSIDSDYEEEQLVAIHQEKDELSTRTNRRRRAAAIKAKSVNRAIYQHESSLARVVENENIAVGSMPENLGRERSNCELSKTELIQEEDKLLFNRMLSVFFWPMLCTKNSVPEKAKSAVNEKIAEMNHLCNVYVSSGEEDIVIENPLPKPKFSGKLGYLDLEEQADLINILESRRTKNIFPKKRQEISNEMQNFIINGGSDSDDEGRSSRKEIISMKRSLVIKKLWEDRRKGLKPKRKDRGNPSEKRKTSVEGSRKSSRVAKKRKIDENFVI